MKKWNDEAEKIMRERFGKDTVIAIAGEWFTAHGKGVSLGYFGKKENQIMAEKLRNVFAEWIDNGHNNDLYPI